MQTIQTPDAPSTFVAPDGTMTTTPTVLLTPDQARLLRAYQRFILEPMHLRRLLVCQACQAELEPESVEVNDQFIVLTCGCLTRYFAGPTPIAPFTVPSEADAAPALIGLDGQVPVRLRYTVTDVQAHLLRDYQRHVLRALGLKEADHCDRCFAAHHITNDGVRFIVTPTTVLIECRCTERHGSSL